MNDFYNHIQYVVPEKSEISFSILPETRHVFVKLLDGVADIYMNDEQNRLHLNQEFSIQFWECMFPRLKTKTVCNFLVRGNHYVSSAVQHGLVDNTLFAVSPGDNSYSFVLEKNIQFQIFPGVPTDQESCVTINSSRGAPEISGFKLSCETTYHLSPFLPLLLKSSDEKPYSICVQGLDRKVKLSIRDENYHKCANDVKDRIFASCLLQKQFKHIKPTILVIGPRNAGKTSFCELLVKETFEKNMTPIYVDLNVKRNLTVPGSLSLSEIESRIDSPLDFKYNFQRLLHYGAVVFHSQSVRLYFFLIRKMGELLSFHLLYKSKENSLSIIDSDGSLGENNTTIELLLNAFAVDFVVYIGDKHYYENLKKSVLENVPSQFIPKPRNIEEPTSSYEGKYYQQKIQKYFFGSSYPSTRKARTVALRQLTIYRISPLPHVTVTRGEIASEFRIERIDFNPSMNPKLIKRLFGVSTAKKVELHAITEIKYYVYFTDIDMTSAMATVIVPESKNFDGGILLMGQILKTEDSEIS